MPKPSAQLVSAFRAGLAEGGYVEGRNLAVEYRWAEAQYDSLPELAAGLVARKVAVIAAMNGVPTALAAKAATSTIPIVFFVGVDPVAFGLVASLNRPGGNVTGVTGLGTELGPKRLEMLKTLRPAASSFAFVVNPSNAAAMTQSKDLQAAAHVESIGGRWGGDRCRWIHEFPDQSDCCSSAALLDADSLSVSCICSCWRSHKLRWKHHGGV
jgi:putative ABC transport system substrate-binding protein